MNNQTHFDLVLLGADHQNFCEAYLVCNPIFIKKPTVLGKDLDPYLAMQAMDASLELFFSAEDPSTLSSILPGKKTAIEEFFDFCLDDKKKLEPSAATSHVKKHKKQKKDTHHRHSHSHSHRHHTKETLDFLHGTLVHESAIFANIAMDDIVKKIYEKYIQ